MNRYQLEENLSLLPTLARVSKANLYPTDFEKIQFGDHPQQFALMCVPPDDVPRQKQAIAFVHGGGWRMGNPDLFRFVGTFFTQLGFPTLLAGYRLAPAEKFPAQLEDLYNGIQAGVQAVRHAGFDSAQWVLGGQSAGAHLAALVAYSDPARCAALLGQLTGLFLISGPLDFSLCTTGEIGAMVSDLLAEEQDRHLADPLHYLRGGETLPVLCVHGDRDPLVDPRNSQVFAQKIGAAARVELLQGWHHADLAEIFLDVDSVPAQVFIHWLKAL